MHKGLDSKLGLVCEMGIPNLQWSTMASSGCPPQLFQVQGTGMYVYFYKGILFVNS